MRKLLLILIFPALIFAQAKYFLPIPVESNSGKPIRDELVTLKNVGGSTIIATLNWFDGGRYYWTGGESTVPAGAYDVYVNGKLYTPNVSVYYNENANAAISDSLRSDYNLQSIRNVINNQKIYNVLDYGAAGDGVEDDTEEIQDLIDLVIYNGGGQVYLPPGEYAISSSLRIVGNYCYMTGYGAFIIPLSGANNDTAIVIGNGETTNTWYTTIRGITISDNGSYDFAVGIGVEGAHFYNLTENTIYYCDSSAVTCNDGYYGVIGPRNRMYGNYRGVYLLDNSNIIQIFDNSISSNILAQVELSYCEAVDLVGNSLEGGQYGILHDDDEGGEVSYNPIQSLNVKSNYFENNSESNIKIGTGDYANSVLIESNFINNNSCTDSSIMIGRTKKTEIRANNFMTDPRDTPPITIMPDIYRTVIFTDVPFNDIPEDDYWKYIWIYQTPGDFYTAGTTDYLTWKHNFLDKFAVFTGVENSSENSSTTYADPFRVVWDKYHRNITMLDDSLGFRVKTASGVYVFLGGSDTIPDQTGGDYNPGSYIFSSDADSGKNVGWVCTEGGTYGTLSSVTANATGYVTSWCTVNSAADLEVGQYIDVAASDVKGVKITEIDLGAGAIRDTVYVTPNFYFGAGSASNSAVSWHDAIFTTFGQAGYRTYAGSPASHLTPYFIGEEVLDTTNHIWYKSYGLTNTSWTALD